MLPLVLVTGFLGSGKTTLLQHLSQKLSGRKLAWLINEFAELDVDGRRFNLGSDEDGQHAIAVAGGSIFCRCKTGEFLKALGAILDSDEDYEGIIVEASGMADPRVLPRMIDEAGFTGRLQLRRCMTVVDPDTLPRLTATLPAIGYQISAADTVIINKTDLADENGIADSLARVQDINPAAQVLLATRCEVDLDPLDQAILPEVDGEYAGCADPRYATHVFTFTNPVDIAEVEALFASHRAVALRAKGRLNAGETAYEVDWAGSKWNHDPVKLEGPSQLVVIAHADAGASSDAFAKAIQSFAVASGAQTRAAPVGPMLQVGNIL